MKFSGKMCLMINLKVTKNQGFTLCLEDTIFKKTPGGGDQIDSPRGFRVKWLRPSLNLVISLNPLGL